MPIQITYRDTPACWQCTVELTNVAWCNSADEAAEDALQGTLCQIAEVAERCGAKLAASGPAFLSISRAPDIEPNSEEFKEQEAARGHAAIKALADHLLTRGLYLARIYAVTPSNTEPPEWENFYPNENGPVKLVINGRNVDSHLSIAQEAPDAE